MTVITRRAAVSGLLLTAIGSKWTRADEALNLRITQDTPIILLPFFVAKEVGLWEKNEVQVTPVPAVIGMPNLIAVSGGALDVGIVAMVANSIAALNSATVRPLASYVRFEAMELACKKEIKSTAELSGKKIAILQGTDSQYYLHLLTQKYGIASSALTTVRLNPAEMASALASGAIDGFVWQEPFLTKAVAVDPNRFHRLAEPGLMQLNAFAVTSDKAIGQKRPLLVKMLKTLDQACDYIAKNPEEAVSIGAKYSQMDPAITASTIPRMELSLKLDVPSYAAGMEDIARWAIAENVVRPDAKMPDFAKCFAPDLLGEARQA
jgi:ABC-type nitrate/sulfonate/bicarbonate transport system substrate-binding protein